MKGRYEQFADLPDKDFSWHTKAVCRDVDPDIFFAESYDPAQNKARVKEARAICARCPVKKLCLEQALTNGEGSYIFGGKTAEERKVILQQRKRTQL